MDTDEKDVVIIGGGQAGFATGRELTRLGADFTILDAGDEIGDSWRTRWDSLELFTTASVTKLPGMPFPAARDHYPSKDEMADYLRAYADRFELPVRNRQAVRRVTRDGDRFVVHLDEGRTVGARAVVVATGAAHNPWRPEFAAELDPSIVQMHSDEYRSPSQVPDGPVLIVGAGNSGAEIAKDLVPAHEVVMAGPDTGRLPVRIGGPIYRLMNTVFRAGTPQGRWFTSGQSSKGTPLVRVTAEELADAGVRRTGRVTGVDDQGRPVLDDGSPVTCSTVVWCTGYRPDYRWVELAGVGEHGPEHERGVVAAEPGLYFVGLPFQYTLDSSLVSGVGRDAAHVAKHACRHVVPTGSAVRV